MGLQPDGYVFEGGLFSADGQTGHWVFFGFRTSAALRNYGSLGTRVGSERVRNRHGSWWRARGVGGIFGGHLTLVWHERGFVYGVSDHIGYPFNTTPDPGNGSAAVRREMIAVADRMRRTG
jgi:hypothetical protein